MFYLNSNAGKVIYDTEINSIFESVYIKIIKKIRKYQVEDPDQTIDSVIELSINVSKYLYFETLILPTITNGWFYPLTGSSFIKSPKELNHSRKNLIDIQKINEKSKI